MQGRIEGEGARDARFSNTTGILPKKNVRFIGVEVEQETSAPPRKKSLIRPALYRNLSGEIQL